MRRDSSAARAATAASSRRGGKWQVKVLPRPSVLSISSVPPWRCSTCLTMARPRPEPPRRAAAARIDAIEALGEARQVFGGDADAGVADREVAARPRPPTSGSRIAPVGAACTWRRCRPGCENAEWISASSPSRLRRRLDLPARTLADAARRASTSLRSTRAQRRHVDRLALGRRARRPRGATARAGPGRCAFMRWAWRRISCSGPRSAGSSARPAAGSRGSRRSR